VINKHKGMGQKQEQKGQIFLQLVFSALVMCQSQNTEQDGMLLVAAATTLICLCHQECLKYCGGPSNALVQG
jgi:hypothetical protein